MTANQHPGNVVDVHGQSYPIEGASSFEDQFQRALEQVFAPIPRNLFEAACAFEMIKDAGMEPSLAMAGEIWYHATVDLLANAILLKFDLQKDSFQTKILRPQRDAYNAQTLGESFLAAQITRSATMHRIIEHMLEGSAAVRQTPRSSAASKQAHPRERRATAEPGLLLSLFPMFGNPAMALPTRERALLALVTKIPDTVLRLPGFRQIMDWRLQSGRGIEFIDELSRNLRKVRRRIERGNPLKVDSLLFIMTQHWINPDYPLWTMREPAATKVLNLALGLDGNLTDAFREKRRKHFPGLSTYMILDATVERIEGGARKITNYKLVGGEAIAK